jgi:hypothetical protein
MTAPFYELAILGKAPDGVIEQVCQELQDRLGELSFTPNGEVSVFVGSPSDFRPSGEKCSAALCFSIGADQEHGIATLMAKGVAVVPVATSSKAFGSEFPDSVASLNGMALDKAGVTDLVLALMECASLLPRQRRVFISYRRDESTEAALQLYAALSARLYDVFLDTHDIQPGKHFQEVLWQRLCDSDVLLFLDTPKYFESRWTDAEFGRANWRGIPLLRAAWPDVALSERAQLATSIDLVGADFAGQPGHLTDAAVRRICDGVEDTRTRSVASRFQQLITTLRHSVERGKGRVEGLSLRRSLIVATPNGKRIAVYPALGVPTSYTLYDATRDNHPPPVAVVYDDAGVDEREWRAHMDWISQYVKGAVRLVSSYKAGWDFSDWK